METAESTEKQQLVSCQSGNETLIFCVRNHFKKLQTVSLKERILDSLPVLWSVRKEEPYIDTSPINTNLYSAISSHCTVHSKTNTKTNKI